MACLLVTGCTGCRRSATGGCDVRGWSICVHDSKGTGDWKMIQDCGRELLFASETTAQAYANEHVAGLELYYLASAFIAEYHDTGTPYVWWSPEPTTDGVNRDE